VFILGGRRAGGGQGEAQAFSEFNLIGLIQGDLVRGEFEINQAIKEVPTLKEVWVKFVITL
jgi:hypothetical protein